MIEGVSKVEFHDGTVIEDVQSVELLTGGVLKVTRWFDKDGNTFARSTYVPPGLWKPFDQRLPTLVVKPHGGAEFQVPGLAGDALYEYVYRLLKDDGCDDTNARYGANNVLTKRHLDGVGYGDSSYQFFFVY